MMSNDRLYQEMQGRGSGILGEVDGNRRDGGREPDGNRRAPAPAPDHRSSPHRHKPSRPQAGKPRPRREREVPALFGGGERDD
jgi:hypothetical protein